MRAICLDIGDKRIGIAKSLSGTTVAVPVSVFHRTNDWLVDLERLVADVSVEEPDLVVVGIPLSLSGEISQQGRKVIAEAAAIAERMSTKVVLWDERFSSKSARKEMRLAGYSEREMRGRLDASAAAVILEDFLTSSDQQRMGDPRNYEHGDPSE